MTNKQPTWLDQASAPEERIKLFVRHVIGRLEKDATEASWALDIYNTFAAVPAYELATVGVSFKNSRSLVMDYLVRLHARLLEMYPERDLDSLRLAADWIRDHEAELKKQK
jgi:hypothetical protein